MKSSERGIWWGDHALPMDTTGYWRIGPFHLWIRRSEREWAAGSRRDDDLLDDTVEIEVPATDVPGFDEERVDWRHFAFEQTGKGIRLVPRLADRGIVVRLRRSLTLPPGERATLYLSTPVWLALSVDEDRKRLLDLPTRILSDTWFGSPLEGEMCYASRTHGLRQLDELPMLPYRAATRVDVVNPAGTPFDLDRIGLPAPHLSLYGTEEGALWTEAVKITRHADHEEMAHVELSRQAPEKVETGDRVSEPRVLAGKTFMTRAFAKIFGR